MEFRESFTLTESDPAQFGIQKVRLQRYRGSQPAPEWADQDECKLSSFSSSFSFRPCSLQRRFRHSVLSTLT